MDNKGPTAEYDWPETCLYDQLGPEIPHAIGAIAINIVFLESALESILWCYLGMNPEVAPFITTHLPNNSRAELLVTLANVEEKDANVLAAVLHCITAAKRMTDNRNIIMHSLCTPSAGGVLLVKRNARKTVTRKTYRLNALNLAEIGSEIRAYFHYATVIVEHLRARKAGGRVKLLPMPPFPTELIPGEG